MPDRVLALFGNHQVAFPLFHGSLHSAIDPLLVRLPHQKPVNHYFYIMHFIAVELQSKSDFPYLTIHPHPKVTLLPDLLEQFTVMSFTPFDQWSQYGNVFSIKIF